MAIKVVIASGKGGVGKSTICKNLGLSFASQGKRTLLVDGDAGLAGLDIMLGVSENISFSWYDAIIERCTPSDAVYEVNDNLHLLSSPKNTVNEDVTDKLVKLISSIEENYDVILIDSPAGLGRGLRRASAAADKALIVATADEVSVKGAAAVEKLLSSLGVTQSRLLINRYDIKAAKKGLLLGVDGIINKTAVQLIGIIPEDRNIIYSTVYEKKLKTTLSDRAFMRISKRIDGQNVELSLSQLK